MTWWVFFSGCNKTFTTADAENGPPASYKNALILHIHFCFSPFGKEAVEHPEQEQQTEEQCLSNSCEITELWLCSLGCFPLEDENKSGIYTNWTNAWHPNVQLSKYLPTSGVFVHHDLGCPLNFYFDLLVRFTCLVARLIFFYLLFALLFILFTFWLQLGPQSPFCLILTWMTIKSQSFYE